MAWLRLPLATARTKLPLERNIRWSGTRPPLHKIQNSCLAVHPTHSMEFIEATLTNPSWPFPYRRTE